MNKTEEAYKEILKVLKKYKDDIVFDVDTLEEKSKNHLFGIKLVEKYGFKNINPKYIYSTDWQELKGNMSIGFYDGKRRKISWSDNDKQPKNETLLCISFPTGPYIFGNDYPTEVFNEFFNELKKYKPKYVDSHNHSLYFSLNNAGKVYNNYDDIFNKYIDKGEEYVRKLRIKNLEKELSELKND